MASLKTAHFSLTGSLLVFSSYSAEIWNQKHKTIITRCEIIWCSLLAEQDQVSIKLTKCVSCITLTVLYIRARSIFGCTFLWLTMTSHMAPGFLCDNYIWLAGFMEWRSVTWHHYLWLYTALYTVYTAVWPLFSLNLSTKIMWTVFLRNRHLVTLWQSMFKPQHDIKHTVTSDKSSLREIRACDAL